MTSYSFSLTDLEAKKLLDVLEKSKVHKDFCVSFGNALQRKRYGEQ